MLEVTSAQGRHSAAQAAVLPLARVIERDDMLVTALYIPADRVIFVSSGLDEVAGQRVIRRVMECQLVAADRSAI